MMKIIAFNGSPRGPRSNTHAIVAPFLEGAQAAGAETENVFLVDHDIRHCRGCYVCWIKTPGRCIIEDDMAGLLGKMAAADVIVFATPLYVDNVSGIMKQFLDRLIPAADPHFYKDENGECRHIPREGMLASKRFVIVSNCGFAEVSHFQVLRLYFRRMARNINSRVVGEIYRTEGELFPLKMPGLSPILDAYRDRVRTAGRELVETGAISETTSARLEEPLIPEALYISGANRWWDKNLAECGA
ncbi:MAG TPA: flavodoxin family protein [Candidatus Hydrogenedentes bacterium]|nr:flavodoxin family protein [Candidatus Hydrogenedentota bacterium]